MRTRRGEEYGACIQCGAISLEMEAGEGTLGELVCETAVEIRNTDGLHMRPAMQFVDVASQFACDVTVSSGKTTVDGKSIMQMSMLAARRGTKLKIKTEGPGAQEAINALQQLVEEKMFGEPAPSDGKQ